MRLDADVRRCVVFIGHQPNFDDDDTFDAVGTGFFVHYRGIRWLVTAQHVAMHFEDAPFFLRINRTEGGSDVFHVDPLQAVEMRWISHPDESVDLAAIPFHISEKASGLDLLSVNSELLLSDDKVRELGLNVGDLCYGVGLFKLMQGSKRNVPIVHTGHIALMPGDEEIPVKDWTKGPTAPPKLVRGYLVEIQNLKGLSGSPVLVRSTINAVVPTFERGGGGTRATGSSYVGAYDADLHLLGVWSASWDGFGDRAASREYGNTRIPLGMGTVVPAGRIIELLETDAATDRIRHVTRMLNAMNIMKPDKNP